MGSSVVSPQKPRVANVLQGAGVRAPRLDETGRRILIVEDETIVSMLLEGMLLDLGHDIIGPVRTLSEALTAVRKVKPDLAIIDVNLQGICSFPVADILRKRNIPFIFVTGYGKAGIEDKYTNTLVLQKPFDIVHLSDIIAKAFESARRT